MHYIWYILWPTLSFNSKRRQNFSVIFDFSLLEWRVAKNRTHDFWLRFYFLRFWPISHFCFLWNRYLKLKVHHNIRTAHFLRNRRHGFAQRLFRQIYTAFKGLPPKIFWVRARILYAHRKSSQKAYISSLVL